MRMKFLSIISIVVFGILGLLLSSCGLETASTEESLVEDLPSEESKIDVVSSPLAVHSFFDTGWDVWNRTDRWNISYCVQQGVWNRHRPRLLTMLHRATSAWENVCDVRFRHDSIHDATCDASNTGNVTFNVVHNASTIGSMGYPSYYPNILLSLGPIWGWTDEFLLAVLLHELSHGLGFVHEHVRSTDPNRCVDPGADPHSAVTVYDSHSVTHYPWCPDWSNPVGGTPNYITHWDIVGAQRVYEAPTNVLNDINGRLFARQRSTGDIYYLDNFTWTPIGGPGQAFVTVGDTLYGLSTGGFPAVWNGLGQGWTYIGDYKGQIFNCAEALCATDGDTGDIARYDSSKKEWNIIGEPGSRFAGMRYQGWIFGIGPEQDYTAVHLPGSDHWDPNGGPASELIGGGYSMWRITPDRDAIEEWSWFANWTEISDFSGGQLLASDSALYYKTGDGHIFEFKPESSSWTYIGGPEEKKAARMYGSYGYLFATSPSDESIFHYRAATREWVPYGKP